MLAPRRRCLDYSKVYCDVTEKWLLAWNKNKHIKYYIFHTIIPKSALVFHTFASFRLMTLTSSLCGSSMWLADFNFGPCRGKFVVQKSIILAPLWVDVFWTIQIPDILHLHAVLLTRLAWLKLSNNMEDSQKQFEKERHL